MKRSGPGIVKEGDAGSRTPKSTGKAGSCKMPVIVRKVTVIVIGRTSNSSK
jgi:hypothetical protein